MSNKKNILGNLSYNEYLNHWIWKDKRQALLKLTEYTCERCGKHKFIKNGIPGNIKLILHVHHLNYDNLGNEGRKDVIVLCKSCHELEHGMEFKND